MSKKKGWYKGFHMWLNPDGIANLLSAGLLEAEGHMIEYKTQDRGRLDSYYSYCEKIVFQRKSEGVLQGFPYVKMNENPTGVALLQTTIREAYEGFSKGEVKGEGGDPNTPGTSKIGESF